MIRLIREMRESGDIEHHSVLHCCVMSKKLEEVADSQAGRIVPTRTWEEERRATASSSKWKLWGRRDVCRDIESGMRLRHHCSNRIKLILSESVAIRDLYQVRKIATCRSGGSVIGATAWKIFSEGHGDDVAAVIQSKRSREWPSINAVTAAMRTVTSEWSRVMTFPATLSGLFRPRS